jgi:hypothetical protein
VNLVGKLKRAWQAEGKDEEKLYLKYMGIDTSERFQLQV